MLPPFGSFKVLNSFFAASIFSFSLGGGGGGVGVADFSIGIRFAAGKLDYRSILVLLLIPWKVWEILVNFFFCPKIKLERRSRTAPS